MAAAKKAAKKGMGIEATAEVKLSMGDSTMDLGEVVLSYRTSSESGHRRSSGMVIQVSLEDGAIMKDPAAARALVKNEARTILRKMAAAIK